MKTARNSVELCNRFKSEMAGDLINSLSPGGRYKALTMRPHQNNSDTKPIALVASCDAERAKAEEDSYRISSTQTVDTPPLQTYLLRSNLNLLTFSYAP